MWVTHELSKEQQFIEFLQKNELSPDNLEYYGTTNKRKHLSVPRQRNGIWYTQVFVPEQTMLQGVISAQEHEAMCVANSRFRIACLHQAVEARHSTIGSLSLEELDFSAARQYYLPCKDLIRRDLGLFVAMLRDVFDCRIDIDVIEPLRHLEGARLGNRIRHKRMLIGGLQPSTKKQLTIKVSALSDQVAIHFFPGGTAYRFLFDVLRAEFLPESYHVRLTLKAEQYNSKRLNTGIKLNKMTIT